MCCGIFDEAFDVDHATIVLVVRRVTKSGSGSGTSEIASDSSHSRSGRPKTWHSMASSAHHAAGLPGRRLHEAKQQELTAMPRVMTKVADQQSLGSNPEESEDSQNEPVVADCEDPDQDRLTTV